MLIRRRRYNGNVPGSNGTGGEGGNGNNGGNAGDQGGNGSGGGNSGNQNQGQQTPQAPAGITPEIQAWVASEAQRLTNLAAATVRTQEQQKYERQQAEAQATADAAAAVKRGEFETLYNTEKAAHEATKLQAGKVTTLSAAVHTGIDTEIANWPDEVKALDPGKEADAESRIKWVNSARALAARLAGGGNGSGGRQAPQGEHGGGNKPQGGGNAGGGNGNSVPVNNNQAVTNYANKTYGKPDFTKRS